MKKLVRNGMAAAVALGLLALIPVFAADSQGNNVVVTRPGVVFHKAGADDIRGHSVERSVDAALESGYTPCPVCFAKEIAAARSGSVEIPGAAAPSAYGAVSIPAPPTTTVSQPFGLRYATSKFGHPPKEAIKNPYEEQNQVVPGRAEQGAFDEH
jgi:hypothetical protein